MAHGMGQLVVFLLQFRVSGKWIHLPSCAIHVPEYIGNLLTVGNTQRLLINTSRHSVEVVGITPDAMVSPHLICEPTASSEHHIAHPEGHFAVFRTKLRTRIGEHSA